jgi:hypothetical protein
VWDASALGPGIHEGREAIRGEFDDWFAACEDIEIEIEEFCDLGNGVTFGAVATRGRLRGSSSGLLEFRYGQTVEWKCD